MHIISYIVAIVLSIIVFIANVGYYKYQVMQPVNWYKSIVYALVMGAATLLIFYLVSKIK